jgi:quinoprotein glucose dehydrogenase
MFASIRRCRRALFLALSAGFISIAAAQPAKKETPYTPTVRTDNGDGAAAIKRFQYDKALTVDLWASEPMLANPVCFALDGKGRCYVAETFRLHAGVTDDRGHMNWLDEDLAARTVDDRIALYKKYAKDNFERIYEKERDRVRLLEDTTGTGKADKATTFCDDFGHAADGIGAGLLARNGSVYFTNIPDLWRLKDTKGTGTADVKQSLGTGFGVHVSFIGHDMHGLRMGPDGRLYFSIGDRGLNVKTKEGKHLYLPDTGAVLRCDPDGSNLEIVHIGLRNPQELAFDDYGNLFTVDNNSDSGDRARFVWIVEGGDSGWRIGYQYETAMHDSSVRQGNRGPWNYEKLWHPYHEGQPAFIVPPLANFADGPSGFCHYPGVGLGDQYKGHFFLCDFRGSPNGSGVWSFTTKPKGASFELVNPRHFLWNVLATDCDFGPDSAFYVSDWVDGWNLTGRGRIYKVSDPKEQKTEIVAEVKKLLAEGFDKRPTTELAKLLEHPHQQVRQEAQFALAAKGKEAIEPLMKVAKENKNRLARLHTIWAVGMIARQPREANSDPVDLKTVIALLNDRDLEIRAQVVKVLGELKLAFRRPEARDLLKDHEPRVRYFALLALGQLPNRPTKRDQMFPEVLREDLDKTWQAVRDTVVEDKWDDPYLRHAAVMALSTFVPDFLSQNNNQERVRNHPSASVRLIYLLAAREHCNYKSRPFESDTLGFFLGDVDPRIVNEAARAIHDLNLGSMPQLAAILAKPGIPIEALYRALNANFRLGKPENATALATFAAKSDAPETLRVLALKMLGSWAKPPRRDYITGLTQNLGERDASVAANAMKARLGGIFAGPATVQKEAAAAAGKLGITEVGPFLFNLLTDAKATPTARAEALNALEVLKDKRLAEAVTTAIGSADPRLRNTGRAILMKSNPDEVVQQLKDVLAKNDLVEKQGAFDLLATIKSSEADHLIEVWLDKLMKKQAPPELSLDILEAAAKRDGAALKQHLKSFEEARPKVDELAAWRETLHGGDAERGRQIFLNKAAVQCQRCHKLDGEGGEVGPPLNGIAAKQKRDYLLESIVLPNKQIAKGYDSILITKADGKSVNGVLKSEDDKQVKIMTAEGLLVTVKKDDIDQRRTTKSAMPEDIVQKLSKRELRDLVEFLAGLKEEWKK